VKTSRGKKKKTGDHTGGNDSLLTKKRIKKKSGKKKKKGKRKRRTCVLAVMEEKKGKEGREGGFIPLRALAAHGKGERGEEETGGILVDWDQTRSKKGNMGEEKKTKRDEKSRSVMFAAAEKERRKAGPTLSDVRKKKVKNGRRKGGDNIDITAPLKKRGGRMEKRRSDCG